MEHEFEPSPEESCKCAFFAVAINTQHTKERESFSPLIGNV